MAVAHPAVTANRSRTQKARQAFDSKFSTAEERSDFFREIGRRGNARRLLLRPDEAEILAAASIIMARLADRAQGVPDGTA